MADERRRAADRLDSALPSLARLVALHSSVPDEDIVAALGSTAGDQPSNAGPDPFTFDSARRLVASLGAPPRSPPPPRPYRARPAHGRTARCHPPPPPPPPRPRHRPHPPDGLAHRPPGPPWPPRARHRQPPPRQVRAVEVHHGRLE